MRLKSYRVEFQERSQLFIHVHNETLSAAAMRISNPRSFARWNPRLTEIAQSSRLLFFAEFLENGISAQRAPEWIEPEEGCGRNDRWVNPAVIGRL